MGSPYFARWAQYGLLSPYFARWAQYGLWLQLCAHCVARIRLRNRPISLSLHTGSCHPGVALRLPRAVFWRPFRALSSPSPNQQRPHRGRPFPLAKSTTPAPRASIPPRRINNTRAAGVHSPSPNQQHPHRRRPFPLAIYGEGVADRPGVRSESSTLALSQPSRSRNRGLFSCRS